MNPSILGLYVQGFLIRFLHQASGAPRGWERRVSGVELRVQVL